MNEEIQYQQLDAEKITATVNTLSERIAERFPESGLLQVSIKLSEIGGRASEQARWIAQPILSLRILSGVLIALIFFGLIALLVTLGNPSKKIGLIDFIQALESGINDVVLIGLAIFFISSIERRLKRHRALKAINELRAIAHIIDMHQLSKDPDRLHWEAKGDLVPKRHLSPLQVTRYLDYCSEMLSLVGKLSVLYVQNFDDPVALAAVNEVESLTTGLSRKIWQKMMIIHHDVK